MSSWYVTAGSARGSGDGSSWANAASWSAITTFYSNGSRVSGDTIYLEAGLLSEQELIYTAPTNFSLTKRINFQGRTAADVDCYATIRGTRTSPWPEDGFISGVSEGPTVFLLKTGSHNSLFKFLKFENLKYAFSVTCNDPGDRISVTLDHIKCKNVTSALYTVGKTDGFCDLTYRKLDIDGYTVAGIKTFGDIYGETTGSTYSHFNSRNNYHTHSTTPYGVHVFDHVAEKASRLSAMEMHRTTILGNSISPPTWKSNITYNNNNKVSYGGIKYKSLQGGNVNNQPDTSPLFWTLDTAYLQGDGVICEESVGIAQFSDLYIAGASDRAIDLKCGAEIKGVYVKNCGYGIANHINASTVNIRNSFIGTPRRIDAETTKLACLQASGTLNVYSSVLELSPSSLADPEPDDLTKYFYASGTVDGMSYQGTLPGTLRRGNITINNSHIRLDSALTTSPSLETGSDNGRWIIVGNLTPGTTYSPSDWTLKSFDQAGSLSSAATLASTPAPTTLAAYSSPADTVDPGAPSGLTASNITNTTMTLSWTAATDNVGVIGYIVMVEIGGTKCWSLATQNTFISMESLTPGTTYTFTVRAYDRTGNFSTDSNQITPTTTGSGSTSGTPGTPTGFQVETSSSNTAAIGPKFMMLTWNAASGSPKGYIVYYQGNPVGVTYVQANSPATATENNVIKFSIRGSYSAGTTYAQHDIVTSGGTKYRSLATSNTGHTPASSASWWSAYY